MFLTAFALFFFFFSPFNLLGFTDRSRPPLTVLSRAIRARASTEGLKRWTVKWCPFLQQGHVFWNAFSGSTRLSQSYAPRRRRPPTPSIVVAHTDSSWLTPPPPPPPLSSDFAQLSKQTSLLSSQAGAQRCSAWAAGGALAWGQLTVFTTQATRSLVNMSRQMFWIRSLLHHHSGHVTRGWDEDAGPTHLSSAYQEAIHRYFTERGGREGSGIAVVHSSSSCFS